MKPGPKCVHPSVAANPAHRQHRGGQHEEAGADQYRIGASLVSVLAAAAAKS